MEQAGDGVDRLAELFAGVRIAQPEAGEGVPALPADVWSLVMQHEDGRRARSLARTAHVLAAAAREHEDKRVPVDQEPHAVVGLPAGLQRDHPDIIEEQRWARRHGMSVLWDVRAGDFRWQCVECGDWERIEREAWDVGLVDVDGRPVTPRDVWHARRALDSEPVEHVDVIGWAESVMRVWPGDVCLRCYRAWH